jgi:hypothetical protein
VETDEPEADFGAAAKADAVRLAGQAVHVERTTSLTIVQHPLAVDGGWRDPEPPWLKRHGGPRDTTEALGLL